MRKILLLTVLFLTCVLSAQDKGNGRTKPPAPENFITTIPVRSVLRDVNIGYGFALDPYHTIEYRIGWVHRNRILHEYYEGWLTSTEMHFRGPSFYVQLNKWKYRANTKRRYWGVSAGYRYLYYHQESLWLGGLGGSTTAERPVLSQWRNDLLLLGSFGLQTSRISTLEFSLGVRVLHTYTHVHDTRFHPINMTGEEYDAYRASQVIEVPYSKGFGIQPVARVTLHVGIFTW